MLYESQSREDVARGRLVLALEEYSTPNPRVLLVQPAAAAMPHRRCARPSTTRAARGRIAARRAAAVSWSVG